MAPTAGAFSRETTSRSGSASARTRSLPASWGTTRSSCTLTVEGLDELHQELAGRGAPVQSEPEDQPWGMREFSIRTPDGHRIRFGERLPAG